MYKQLGYSVYRTVIEYYSASNGEPDEDAYGKFWCICLVEFLIHSPNTTAVTDIHLVWVDNEHILYLIFADMRKALSRDTEKKSIIPLPHPVRPEDIE